MGFRIYFNPHKVARPGRPAGTTTLARGAAQKTSTKNIYADPIDSVTRQVLYEYNNRLRDRSQISFLFDKTRAAGRTGPTPLPSGWHKAAAGVTRAALLDCVIFFAHSRSGPASRGASPYA